MRLRVLIILIIVVALSFPLSAQPGVVNPMLLRVNILTKSDAMVLAKMNLDIALVTGEYVDIVAYPEDEIRIQNAGLHYEIVHRDLVEFYESRMPLGTTMGGYQTLSEVLASIDSLHLLYPGIASARDSVGNSWQGRALWVFKISDNVDIDEDEPEVFFNALIHAREPQGMAWQMNYARWLCQNYATDTAAANLVNNHEIFFMPVVNPDGYEKNRIDNPNGGGMWRKNRRTSPGSVDLNRNWGYMWGFDDVGSSPDPFQETYRGPSAFSEPETQGLRQFIISRDFSFILNAHTYGDYFLYPFGYNDIHTPDQNLYDVLADTALEILGNYTAGTPWELLYNTNGDAMDWEYGEQDEKPLILCATTESGDDMDGFWPAPSRIPQINAQLLPLAKYITKLAENPRVIAPPAVPLISGPDTVTLDTFTLSWIHTDQYNPAVAFELIEKSGYARLTDSLERGADDWQLAGFALSTTRSHSRTHSLHSGDGDNYHSQAYFATPLAIQPNDTLIFYASYNIEADWDYAYVEVSTDGGVTFAGIPGNITTTTNPHGTNRGNGITGTQTSWRRATFPLAQYAGSTIQIRFSYDTDGGTHNGGFYIDDIYPVPHFAQELVISSNIAGNSYLIQGRLNGAYYYQVRARDAQNQWSGFSNPLKVIVERQVSINDDYSIPSDFTLEQNYPNPFNAQTQITFSLASPGNVRLSIYDLGGRLVRKLLKAQANSGNHKVIWDGKDDRGVDVSSGVYFYQMSAENKSLTKRMVLIR